MLSYIEISKENLLHNLRLMRGLVVPGVKLACVIKANAYGHGQNEVAKILENEVDFFQVDDADELRLLREVSTKPTLVLGYVSSDEIAKVIELGAIMGVYAEQQILMIEQVAESLNKKVSVHVKIDACLGRQGVLLENLQHFIDALKTCEHVQVDGIYSHFANIEDTSNFSHAKKQLECFEKAITIFKENGYKNLDTHISASSGIMAYEADGQSPSSIVRPGIATYGMWPSVELAEKLGSVEFKLKPAMRWITRVAQVKTVPANYSIGYGLTFITSVPTKIAVIPQGYSDGFDRGFSNCGEVLIKGTRCKVLGRVAMNMFVVDVSHLENVEAEEEVVLLGTQGEAAITAEEMAAKIESINYEITTRISPLLKRIIV